jgi:undecaprenyl-diphosphatase
MSWIEAVVLGLVQGLTEFLPISSSAHLRVVGEAFGWGDPGAAFTAITQIGTEAAVLLYFRRDIGRIISAWVRSLGDRAMRSDPDARMGWLIIVGTLPIGILGLLFQDRIETTFRDLRIVAIALVAFSLVLYWADRVGRKKRELDQLTVGHGIAFGFAQAMALVPGVSRSGSPSPPSWPRASSRSTRRSPGASRGRRSPGGRRSWPRCWPSASAWPSSPGCCATSTAAASRRSSSTGWCWAC